MAIILNELYFDTAPALENINSHLISIFDTFAEPNWEMSLMREDENEMVFSYGDEESNSSIYLRKKGGRLFLDLNRFHTRTAGLDGDFLGEVILYQDFDIEAINEKLNRRPTRCAVPLYALKQGNITELFVLIEHTQDINAIYAQTENGVCAIEYRPDGKFNSFWLIYYFHYEDDKTILRLRFDEPFERLLSLNTETRDGEMDKYSIER